MHYFIISYILLLDLLSWSGENRPKLPPEWLKEENPLFQALANVGVKKLPVRVVTQGPQIPNIPGSCDMWEWLLLQNAQINFLLTAVKELGGIMVMLDGGEKIMITSMDCSPQSFVYNRNSTIILQSVHSQVSKLFTSAFNSDFSKGIPFMPTKEVITDPNHPLIDPASLAVIQTNVFKITNVEQPPPALVDSPLQPYISKVMEADDVEYVLAMAGPEEVQVTLQHAINVVTYLQVAIRSLSNSIMSQQILSTYLQATSASVILSHTLVDKQEADASDVCTTYFVITCHYVPYIG